jgi:hypothetical protein
MGVRRRPYDSGEDAPCSPTFAICLATADPSTDFFARQIAAFRGQTELNWTCLIHADGSKPESFAAIRGMLGDDRRFQLIRQSTKRGPSGSIENCLARIPSHVEFVALCGPKDIWHRDALAVLRSRFAPRTSLVCTSAIPGNLSELLISDLSLGTAMFRRSVLGLILPFPPGVPDARFYPWIAGVAAIAGTIARIVEPVCETIAASPPAGADQPPSMSLKTRLAEWLADGHRRFAEHAMGIQQLAQALRMASGERLSRAQCQAVDRVADPLWLLMQTGRNWMKLTQTTDHASAVLHGQLWLAIVRIQRAIGFARQRPRESAIVQRRAA